MTAAASGFVGGSYPERDDKPLSKLERAIMAARFYAGKFESRRRGLMRIVDAVNACSPEIDSLDDAGLLASASALKPRLRKDGVTHTELTAQAFAVMREAARRTISMRHFDVQLVGAWSMLNGMLSEMETGEGCGYGS